MDFHGEDFLSEPPVEGDLPTADEFRPRSGLAYRTIDLRLGAGLDPVATCEVYVRSIDFRVDMLLVNPDGGIARRGRDPLAVVVRFRGGAPADLMLEQHDILVTLETSGAPVMWQGMATTIKGDRPVRGALMLPDPFFDEPEDDERARHNAEILAAARPVQWPTDEIADLMAKLGWPRFGPAT